MRIGLVSDTYTPQVNGVTTVVRRIAALLAAQGHEIGIVAPRYAEFAPSDGFPELRVPSVAFPLYPAVRLSLPRARAVAAFFDAFRPELLHVHTEGPLGLIGRRYALRRRLPLVTTFHTNFPEYSRHYGAGLLEPAIWDSCSGFTAPPESPTPRARPSGPSSSAGGSGTPPCGGAGWTAASSIPPSGRLAGGVGSPAATTRRSCCMSGVSRRRRTWRC